MVQPEPALYGGPRVMINLQQQEVHVTVELRGNEPAALADFARTHECRFLHVLLDAGAHPSQPMLSWRQPAGLDAALKRAAVLGRALEEHGMRLLRIKVEGRPEEETEARYYEAHVKVELERGRAPELAALAEELGAHLSRNACSRTSGKEQRFITSRRGSLIDALAAFEHLENALVSRGWRVLSVEREAVLYDNNIDLDAGWST